MSRVFRRKRTYLYHMEEREVDWEGMIFLNGMGQ